MSIASLLVRENIPYDYSLLCDSSQKTPVVCTRQVLPQLAINSCEGADLLPARSAPTMTTSSLNLHHNYQKGTLMTDKPSVLFVCVHNAGRSQMAAGYLNHLTGDAIEVCSAGSAPADLVNPIVVEAMREEGVDLTDQRPKILTSDAVQASDVVITMGCGDACPFFPGKRYLDWQLNDPAGQDLDAVRPIRNEIRRRIEKLITELRSSG